MKQHLLYLILMLSTVQSIAQPTNGLVAYWPLNGNYNDAGPNNINGTNYGSTATTNSNGTAAAAMNFINPLPLSVAQYAVMPANSLLNFSGNQDFSLSLACYLATPYLTPGGIFDQQLNTGGFGLWFWDNPSPGNYKLQFNYKNASIASSVIALGTWMHVCAVRSAGTIKLYVNGVLHSSAAEGTFSPQYNSSARVGTMFYMPYTPPNYNGMNGKIDEIRIYNRALSDAEILSLSSVVLPVRLSSFTASYQPGQVQLNWQTEYEQNSSHFEVERSVNGIDFDKQATVFAAGNSNVVLRYLCNDKLDVFMQSLPVIYYRLKSLDKDGRHVYSQVVAIKPAKNEMQLYVFPNPAKEWLQLQTSRQAAGKAVVVIADMKGGILYKKEMLLQAGSNAVPVNIAMLRSGTYNLSLQDAAGTHTRQFVKTE